MRILLILAIAIIAGGCAPIYYPNAAYTTLPVEAGELAGTARASTSGIEGQILVAPLKNVVVGGSATWLHLPGQSSYTRHTYGELAAGWSDTSGRAFFGAIVGAGLGSTATPPGSRYPWDEGTHDSARYARIFIQGTIGSLAYERSILPGERTNSGFALGMRVAWVRASQLWIDDEALPATSDVFLEPHASWHRQGEHLGIEVDFGVSMSAQRGLRLHSSPLRLGVGVTYVLSGLL